MRTFRRVLITFCITTCVVCLLIGLLTVGIHSKSILLGEEAVGRVRLSGGRILVTDESGERDILPPLEATSPTTALIPAPIRMGAACCRVLVDWAERLLSHF